MRVSQEACSDICSDGELAGSMVEVAQPVRVIGGGNGTECGGKERTIQFTVGFIKFPE